MKKSSLLRNILACGTGALLVILVLVRVHPFPEHTVAFPHANLTIQRADGRKLPFDIAVTTTPEDKTRGLMFVRVMPPEAGMLFLFEPDEMVSMWMKNTYIPLDMLFVRADGTIASIATHTEPFSLTPISADEPVKAVIELNAGTAARDGIATGDKVLFPAFDGK